MKKLFAIAAALCMFALPAKADEGCTSYRLTSFNGRSSIELHSVYTI